MSTISARAARLQAERTARVFRALEAARELREEIALRTAGQSFPTPQEILDAVRDERDEQIDSWLTGRGGEAPALLTVDYLAERARRGSREKLEAALAAVPAGASDAGDEP
jgi:hypothetical protein